MTLDAQLKLVDFSCHNLKPINMQLIRGETVGISGESGAGKSLLLRAIADLIPHQGHCFFKEQDANTFAPYQWRRQVAYLASESQWWFDSIGEHFELPLSEKTKTHIKKIGFTLDTLNWEVTRCSTGERQRLAIIRLLANKPSVLLLDEPTANLDANNSAQVEDIISQYQQQTQCSIIWVTHNKEQIQRVAQWQFEICQSTLTEMQLSEAQA